MIDQVEIGKLSDPQEVVRLLKEHTAVLENDMGSRRFGLTGRRNAVVGAVLGSVFSVGTGTVLGAVLGNMMADHFTATSGLAYLIAKASQMREHSSKRIQDLAEFDYQLGRAQDVLRLYRKNAAIVK